MSTPSTPASLPEIVPQPAIRFAGPLYRALNPVWASMPLSGEGARRHGGRFNPRGMPALYTATSVLGAVREANQIGSPFEPITLVSYDADIFPIFDATDSAALKRKRIKPGDLAADEWRIAMRSGGISASQSWAQKLFRFGYAGMLVPSYARSAPEGARNLVLWRWGDALPHRLEVIDSDGVLNRAKA
jgi:RES domain-containing protein